MWRLILLVVWGGVMGFIYPRGLALVCHRVQSDVMAGAYATFIFTYVVGTLSGHVVGGLAMSVWDPNGLIVVTVGAGILFAFLETARQIRMRDLYSG
jgi:hypothetical protein